MKILLIANSGRPFLGHCLNDIKSFLGNINEVAFVSAAPFIPDKEYLEKVRLALEPIGLKVVHLDVDRSPLATLETAKAVLVGGGNTYRLLKRVREAGLLEPLKARIKKGMPFIGWSAGANIAGPTILTTNDWNVVGLDKFDALGLVPFNINPHYKETDPTAAQFSETRDDRIAEYHKANTNTVLGIEEQTSLRVEDGVVTVQGQGRVRRFEAGQKPVDFRAGQTIDL